MKLTQQRSDILDPKPSEQGFIVGKYDDPLIYAAVPIAGTDTTTGDYTSGERH